jgi:hypothetical protein
MILIYLQINMCWFCASYCIIYADGKINPLAFSAFQKKVSALLPRKKKLLGGVAYAKFGLARWPRREGLHKNS